MERNKKYESYKITVWFGSPVRRETLKGAQAFADRMEKKGKHGTVEGVWFDDQIHFDLLRKF